jgi:hypothetical protein
MTFKNIFPFIFICLLASCAASKQYNPDRKFSRKELQNDYTLLRNILEQKHPSLYWYTPKDSMNFYFDSLYNNIPDSMTELQFGWKILAPLTEKIRCGHTTFSMSKDWGKYIRNRTIPAFPLFMKVWGDTMIVTANLHRKDSVIKPGTLITSINNISNRQLIQQMFQYLPADGYAENVNYIRLSSNFPYFHRNIYGIYKNYKVGFIDSAGLEKQMIVPVWMPPRDTSKIKKQEPVEKISRRKLKKERRENARSMLIDSSINTAVITLNTFNSGGGRRLRSFIKSSFKKIRKQEIKNLIIDLRNNGGGEINMSSLFTKYIRNSKFKMTDTAFAVSKTLAPYTKYIRQGFITNLGLFFLTRKKKLDDNYHFGFYERKTYRPKTKNHFNGKVYVLINGPTFSASTLFCNLIKGQQNVTLVGEEAGGGWHGNNGIMIPDIVLPVTKLRVRLPLFRIVQYNHVAKDGRGVPPDIYIPPIADAVKQGLDRKMIIVKEMIKQETISHLY